MTRVAGAHYPRWTSWPGRRKLPVAPTMSTWSLEDDLNQLQLTMTTMLADPVLSDVCLVVEDIDVPAHKAILAAWSRPFRAMFTLPMLESRHRCRVVIEDAEHQHVKVLLDYLYGGRVALNDENVIPVSALANRYEIVPLMNQCEGYMKWRLNPSNVCRHLLAAEDHQCAYMASFALDYLAVHFDEVHHAGCNDFDPNDFNALASDMVLRVLRHEGLTVDEETVFLAVDGWAKAWRKRRALRETAARARPARSEAQERLEQIAKAVHARTYDTSPDQSRSALRANADKPDLDGPGAAVHGSSSSADCGDRHQPRDSSGGNGPADENDRSLGGQERQDGEVSSSGRPGQPSREEGHDGSDDGTVNVTNNLVVNQHKTTATNGVEFATGTGEKQDQTGRAITTAASATPAKVGAMEGKIHGQDVTVITLPRTLQPVVRSSSGGGGGGGVEMDKDNSSSDTSDVVVVLHSRVDPCSTSVVAAGAATDPYTRGRTCERPDTIQFGGVAAGDSTCGTDGRVGDDKRSTGAGGGVGRAASLSLSPRSSPGMCTDQISAWPVRNSADGVLVGKGLGSSGGVDEEGLQDLPEEERARVDELFEEIRFPLISTSFLCQVVEKSASVAGSRVAQRLLHEAYRFKAIQSTSPADLDEHFPGNHRVKYRGYEQVLFGEDEECVGTVDDYSSSLSEVHLVENVQRRDERYWLPGQPEEAYVCIRLDRVRRITKFRFQNRYSEEFELAVRRTRKEEWQVIVPCQPSGGHKDVKELDLMRKRVKARHVKISLRGRKRSCYNTSVYWTELLGF